MAEVDYKPPLEQARKHLMAARVTKFECMCARVLEKTIDRQDARPDMLSEQVGALTVDLAKWKVGHPVLADVTWKPLWSYIAPIVSASAAASAPTK